VHNLMWLNAGLSAPIICHQQPADCKERSLTGLIGKDKGVIAEVGVIPMGIGCTSAGLPINMLASQIADS